MSTQRSNTTPVFVYGTLRVGEALARLLPDDTPRWSACAWGKLYYAPHTEGYPVFVPEDEATADFVEGELVWLDLDRGDAAYTMMMELRSGYSCEWRTVYVQGNAKAEVSALVFTWNPENGLGRHISSGDWTMRDSGTDRTYFCIECGEAFRRASDALDCEWQHDEDDWSDAVSTAIANDRT